MLSVTGVLPVSRKPCAVERNGAPFRARQPFIGSLVDIFGNLVFFGNLTAVIHVSRNPGGNTFCFVQNIIYLMDVGMPPRPIGPYVQFLFNFLIISIYLFLPIIHQ